MTCAQGLLRLLWGGPEVGVLRDCLLFFIFPTAVTSFLRFHLLHLLLPSFAGGRCFRTCVSVISQLPLPYLFFSFPTPTKSFFFPILKSSLHGFALALFKGKLSFSFFGCCAFYFFNTKSGQIFHFFWPHQTKTSSSVVFLKLKNRYGRFSHGRRKGTDLHLSLSVCLVYVRQRQG